MGIAAKRAAVREARRDMAGWQRWALEAVQRGASRAHAWTRLPQPWRVDVCDELVPPNERQAGLPTLITKYHGDWHVVLGCSRVPPPQG